MSSRLSPRTALLAVYVLLVLGGAGSATAQTQPDRQAAVSRSSLFERIDAPRPLASLLTSALTSSLVTRAFEPSLLRRMPQAPVIEEDGRRERSIGRKILGASIGALGGFFGGGYLGAAIEGDRCQCDDPGLKGAVIGAPIGAAVLALPSAESWDSISYRRT